MASNNPASLELQDKLRNRLLGILQTSNLEEITEHKLRDQLASEFDTPMDAFKELIKAGINDYLDSLEGDADEDEAPAPVTAGTKRKAATSNTQQPSKAAKADTSGKLVWDLSGTKRASVAVFKGSVRVDLREYYKDKETQELKPSQKGLALPIGQWLTLKQQLPAIVDAIQSSTELAPVQLTSDRHAYVNTFQGKQVLHVREMYEKGGKMLPGKHGVCLDAAGVASLLQAADDITSAAQRLSGPATQLELPAKVPTAASAAKSSIPMQENMNPGVAVVGGSGSTKAAPSSSAPASGFIDLGMDKRVTVTTFNNKVYVDMREYYTNTTTKEKAPGKKGIMLSPQQFQLVAQNADAISSAVTEGNANYELDLGDKRKVSLSSFKSKLYIGIREFYEDKSSGALKPGAKGLSMTTEQWSKLAAGLPQLQAQLQQPRDPDAKLV